MTCTSTWRGRVMSFSRYTLVVGKGHAGLGAGRLVLVLEVGGVVDLAHALAAAAGARLDEHGVADLLGKLGGLLDGLDGAVRAGYGGNARRLHGLLGVALLAHAVDNVGIGADKREAVLQALARKLGVLGQEAVAGVHGLAPA